MRWFKHMSHASTGETLSNLMDEMGFEGLGMYWTLVEVVAFHWKGEGPPAMTRSSKAWRKLTGIYPKTFEKLLRNLRGSSGLSVTFSEKGIEVCIPKLLELRDEYSRKSGVCPDNVAPEGEGEGEGKKNTPKAPSRGHPRQGKKSGAKKQPKEHSYTKSFEAFWEEYPRHTAKGKAFESWQKMTLEEQRSAWKAIKAQVASGTHFQGNDGMDYHPHASTWLNQRRWEDDIQGGTNGKTLEEINDQLYL